MIVSRSLLAGLAAALLSQPIVAAQPGGQDVRIEGAWARRAPMVKPGSGTGAVYATLVNAGKSRDALIGAASEVASAAEVHETYQHGDMMMMRPVKKIELPAGGRVQMKPGGFHVMLLNLKRELKAGQTLEVTLVFEKAGRIPVTVTVK